MPSETQYVDGGKGAHKICRGVLTSVDILSMARLQAADVEATQKLKYFLCDMTAVTDLQIDTETVARLVELNRATATYSGGMVGAVVAPNPLAFGMTRMWQKFAYDIDWKVEVFHERATAIEWLRKELGDVPGEDSGLDAYPSLKI